MKFVPVPLVIQINSSDGSVEIDWPEIERAAKGGDIVITMKDYAKALLAVRDGKAKEMEK